MGATQQCASNCPQSATNWAQNLVAPEERGHHVIWRQLGRRFRAKF